MHFRDESVESADRPFRRRAFLIYGKPNLMPEFARDLNISVAQYRNRFPLNTLTLLR